jgi:hypothetical protein
MICKVDVENLICQREKDFILQFAPDILASPSRKN